MTLTDPAGNVGTAATATAPVDRVAPPAFTVTPDNDNYDTTDDTNVGFQITNAEQNGALNWVFILTGVPLNVRGSGTVTNSTMHITGITRPRNPPASIRCT